MKAEKKRVQVTLSAQKQSSSSNSRARKSYLVIVSLFDSTLKGFSEWERGKHTPCSPSGSREDENGSHLLFIHCYFLVVDSDCSLGLHTIEQHCQLPPGATQPPLRKDSSSRPLPPREFALASTRKPVVRASRRSVRRYVPRARRMFSIHRDSVLRLNSTNPLRVIARTDHV